jgi:hypothetical protein
MHPAPPRPPPYPRPSYRPQAYYPSMQPPPGMRAYVTPQGLIFYLAESDATQLARVRVPTPDDELYPVASDTSAAAPSAPPPAASTAKEIPWLAILALAGGAYLLLGRRGRK